jgi:hypothetical protein
MVEPHKPVNSVPPPPPPSFPQSSPAPATYAADDCDYGKRKGTSSTTVRCYACKGPHYFRDCADPDKQQKRAARFANLKQRTSTERDCRGFRRKYTSARAALWKEAAMHCLEEIMGPGTGHAALDAGNPVTTHPPEQLGVGDSECHECHKPGPHKFVDLLKIACDIYKRNRGGSTN